MFAYIRDGVVAHIATSKEEYLQGVEAVIPCDELATVGMLWDGTAFTTPTPIVTYPVLTPMQFYLAFTISERIAIKTSTDPVVKEVWDTYQVALQTGSSIDLNLEDNRNALAYMSANPVGSPILASGRMTTILGV